MKQILQDSTARLWCLSGLTGIVLMAGVLLEEGQARTYDPSAAITSLQVNKPNLQTRSSEMIYSEKSQTLGSSQEKKTQDPAIHTQGTNKKLGKKRMGLAILLLGILAEES